jgi:hypothetical protein
MVTGLTLLKQTANRRNETIIYVRYLPDIQYLICSTGAKLKRFVSLEAGYSAPSS